jgi:hypothetical protein
MTRKLEVGTVLSRVFETYRDQIGLLIPAALIVFVPVAILNGLILTGGGIGLALLASLIGTVATYWYQGMVVEAARDVIVDGKRDHTVGSLFGSVSPVILPLIAAGILAGIGVAIGLVLLIVPGLILLTMWAVIAPAIVIDRAGVFDAFGRSSRLTKGNRWPVFGVIVIIFLLNFVLGAIVQSILGGATDDSFAGYAIADLIVRVFVAPISALAAAVMFFELKEAHGEGLATGAAVPPVATPPAAGPGAPGPEAPQQPAAPPQQPSPGQQAPPPGEPPQAPPPPER